MREREEGGWGFHWEDTHDWVTIVWELITQTERGDVWYRGHEVDNIHTLLPLRKYVNVNQQISTQKNI